MIFTVAAILLAATLFARTYTTALEVIEKTFLPNSTKLQLTDEIFRHNERVENFHYGKIKTEDNLLGYYRVGTAKSKLKDFSYILILDPAGKLIKLEILSYNEVRGKEIRRKSFLKKFQQLSIRKNDPDKIASISGATISSRSLKLAVEADLEVFALIIAEFEK